MSLDNKTLNYRVLTIFAPLLILTGIIGFILPASAGLMSGAPAYNIFHTAAGLVGFLVILLKSGRSARAFNITFGAIDIYQALASFAHLFPVAYFRWRPADDILHVVFGVGLILVGCLRSKKHS